MGRELRRVPLDFDWPLNKVWKGFLNPQYGDSVRNCPFCDQTGYNPETKKIADGWFSFEDTEYVWIVPGKHQFNNKAWQYHLTEHEVRALVEDGRLMDFTHTWSQGTGWVKKDPVVVPIPEEVNEWAKHGMGHDAINRGICVKARAARLGVYGLCGHCNGDGEIWKTPEAKKACEEWEPSNPPKGGAYQIWETVSEGSPVSPPFATPDELADYMVKKSDSGDEFEVSHEQWIKFIKGPGWAPSFVAGPGGLRSGVAAVTE